MRLIRTADMMLEDFPFDPPQYAILSHRWGPPNDEVLFVDMTANLEPARAKAAFHKIRETCRLAENRGLHYCWIDTCCINKQSSAELQEAINSMFQWYKNATICFAYLADVRTRPSDVSGNFERQFQGSDWFTRGWTLQELTAPDTVIFYNQDWSHIGSKTGPLMPIIENITGIHSGILSGQDGHESASVAQRMCWASRRDTSRIEDIAYCLLGLFSVNMAMLYGEGDKAFIRLQKEILNETHDESIFAWCDPECSINETRGLLAEHPRAFSKSGHVVSALQYQPSYEQSFTHRLQDPPTMTGRGLRLQVLLLPFLSRVWPRQTLQPKQELGESLFLNVWIMPIECMVMEQSTPRERPSHYRVGSVLGILLMRGELTGFTRLHASRLIRVSQMSLGSSGIRPYTVFVPQTRYSWPYGNITPPPCYHYMLRDCTIGSGARVDRLKIGSLTNDFTTLAWASDSTTFAWVVTWTHFRTDSQGLLRVKCPVLGRGMQSIAVLWIEIKNSDSWVGPDFNALREMIELRDYYIASWTVTEDKEDSWRQRNTLSMMGSVLSLGVHRFRMNWDPLPKRSITRIPTIMVTMWNNDE